jgi:iron(III) transport system permease protein
LNRQFIHLLKLAPVSLFLVTLVFLLLLPTLNLLFSWNSVDTDIWQHFVKTILSELVINTTLLLLGVGIGTFLLGVSLAWLVVMIEFPGRKLFSWLLLLPFAMPAYVLAFVVLGAFDYGGAFQQFTQVLGLPYMDIREGVLGPALILTLVFYPYVYLLARTAFANQSITMIESARSLGYSSWGVFWKVSLPLARPAIVAGISLALMETLADFGTVALFNYNTLTLAIYSAWEDFRSLATAAQLATILMLIALLTFSVEKLSRGRRGYVQTSRLDTPPFNPSKRYKILAFGFVLLVLLAVLLLPTMQLSVWAYSVITEEWDERYWQWFGNTLLLSVIAVLITIVVALLLNSLEFSRRLPKPLMSLMGVARMGYALPGVVLAMGILGAMAWLNQWLSTQWFIGGLFGLLLAYSVRFLAVAYGPIQSRFQTIKPSIIEAARGLGAGPKRLVWEIYLPLLKAGLMTAAVLVFLDVSKELPATYILRPFGWDTLAIRIFELSAEALYERAAVPSLLLLFMGVVGLLILRRLNLFK